ncbi:MAG: hypothetical protein GYA14_14575 [Ignavibacteria bacterium]|nr:hypothetical protein [Ignavibacteria bacterium]
MRSLQESWKWFKDKLLQALKFSKPLQNKREDPKTALEIPRIKPKTDNLSSRISKVEIPKIEDEGTALPPWCNPKSIKDGNLNILENNLEFDKRKKELEQVKQIIENHNKIRIKKNSSQLSEKQNIEKSNSVKKSEQFLITKPSLQKLYIQVGLDFGTSSTKIAYKILATRDKASVILFNHKLTNYPFYCLPSIAAFNDENKLIMGIEAAKYLEDKNWDHGLRRFKVVVAGKFDEEFYDQHTSDLFYQYIRSKKINYSCEPEFIAAVFLAYAMRQVRTVLKEIYKNCELELSFNICIPIDHIENNKVKEIFEKIIATAELLEKEEMNFNDLTDLLNKSKKYFEDCKYNSEDENCRVFAVPEAVAEIAGYLVSLRARNGIHVVIDFGSGTTDFSIFNLQNVRTSDSTTYWYSARNIPKGMYRIERIFAEFIKSKPFNKSKLSNIVMNISEVPEEVLDKIKKELNCLWKDTHPGWRKAYGHLRKQSEWEKEKVSIFICGGGSQLKFIPEIFSKSWMKDWGPYPVNILPKPDDYVTGDNKYPFERLSLAFGLTIPLPELNNFKLPNDCPDHTPPPLPMREFESWRYRDV